MTHPYPQGEYIDSEEVLDIVLQKLKQAEMERAEVAALEARKESDLPEGNCPRCGKPWITHDCWVKSDAASPQPSEGWEATLFHDFFLDGNACVRHLKIRDYIRALLRTEREAAVREEREYIRGEFQVSHRLQNHLDQPPKDQSQ